MRYLLKKRLLITLFLFSTCFAFMNDVKIPVVLIHGIGGGTIQWEETIATLDYPAAVINIDLFGNQDIRIKNVTRNVKLWNVSFYTPNFVAETFFSNIDTFAKRVSRSIDYILDQTRSNQVILIGHSMGGIVARRYMTLNKSCWDKVYKVLTIGSPHAGVDISFGIFGQLIDVQPGSNLLISINKKWAIYAETETYNKWGVIGAYDDTNPLNQVGNPDATDSGGPGWVALKSSIPFGEWKEAFSSMNTVVLNTPHFGFRLAVSANHLGLLTHSGTLKGIEWATK